MKILSTASSQIILLTIFVVCFLFAPRAGFSQKNKVTVSRSASIAGSAGDLDASEFHIFELVNAERTRRGLSALSFDPAAVSVARDYSKKMAREHFFSHYDSNGESVLQRAKRGHLKNWSKIGENLFSVEGLARFDAFAVKNWMKSSAHRQNILDRDWTHAGVGIARSASGEIFITQIFIKR